MNCFWGCENRGFLKIVEF